MTYSSCHTLNDSIFYCQGSTFVKKTLDVQNSRKHANPSQGSFFEWNPHHSEIPDLGFETVLVPIRISNILPQHGHLVFPGII